MKPVAFIKEKAWIIGAVLFTAAVLGLLVWLRLFFAYTPDEEALSVLNEAAVVTCGSEMTDSFTYDGRQRVGDARLRKMTFTLQNGSQAVFAFPDDVGRSRVVYWERDGDFQRVFFAEEDSSGLDNDGEWIDGWS